MKIFTKQYLSLLSFRVLTTYKEVSCCFFNINKMKNYVIATFLLFSISSFYAQTMCLSCKGSGRSWQKGQHFKKKYIGTERKVVMGKVVYVEKYQDAYKTDGKYITCSACGGRGTVNVTPRKTNTTKTKPVVRKLTPKEIYEQSKNKAKKIFTKQLIDIGDDFFVGKKNDGTFRLVKVHRDKLKLEIFNVTYHDYKKIMDLDGKSLVGHSFTIKNSSGKVVKTDLYDDEKYLFLESYGDVRPTIYKWVFWIYDKDGNPQLFDDEKYLFLESYGDVRPTIYKWVFWIYDKDGNPQLFDDDNKRNINTQKIKFPTKKFKNFDYFLFYNELFPSIIKTKDFRGKDTYALGVYNRKGKLIVPAKNEKILDFDDRTMSLAVVNNYGLVDVYNAKNGFLKFPRGVVVKKCKNGATILKDKKFSYDARDANGRTRQVEAYTYIGKNGFRIPYVLKSCECRDVNNNLKIELYRHGKYIVNGKNEFIPLKK